MWGAVQGQGVVWAGGDVSKLGEMEGEMMICGIDCGNHPTRPDRLLGWAGYSGAEEGGGKGRATG